MTIPVPMSVLAAGNGAFAAKASAIKPIVIIKSPEYKDVPAQEQVKKDSIRDQNDPRLEESTKQIYAKEFYGGVLTDNAGKFANVKVSDARERVREWLEEKNKADEMLEMANPPVRCRCGAVCVVKMLENQWLIIRWTGCIRERVPVSTALEHHCRGIKTG